MADKHAFVSTARHFAERAAKATDPADRARLLAAAGFYFWFAEAASKSIINDPGYWRERACETRTEAERLTDEQDKQTILCIAKDYDRLAEQGEQQPVTGGRLTERFDSVWIETGDSLPQSRRSMN